MLGVCLSVRFYLWELGAACHRYVLVHKLYVHKRMNFFLRTLGLACWQMCFRLQVSSLDMVWCKLFELEMQMGCLPRE